MKRAFYAVNGVRGLEANPNFVAQVLSKLPSRSSKLAVMCDAGGTLQPSGAFVYGKSSRSLIAIWLLLNAGFTEVVHAAGGLREWASDELPLEGSQPEFWKERAGAMPK